MPDIIFILLLALVIFGPKKMPEIARQIGRYLAQFRQIRDGFRSQLQSEIIRMEAAEVSQDRIDQQVTRTNDSSAPVTETPEA
jgi:TatA/E family protein of Tat protein translocase